FFSSRRRHTRWPRDWSSDVCSSDLKPNIDDRHAKVPEGAKPRGEIEFRHLTFTYPTTLSGAGTNGASKSNGSGPHPVLRDIHLRSEERRVGKECTSRWTRSPWNDI